MRVSDRRSHDDRVVMGEVVVDPPLPEHAFEDPARTEDLHRGLHVSMVGEDGTERSSDGVAAGRSYAGDSRGYVERRLLAISDLVALCASGVAAAGLTVLADRPAVGGDDLIAFAICLLVWLPLASAIGLYHLPNRRLGPSGADEIMPIVFALTLWSWAFLIVRAIIGEGTPILFGSVAVWMVALLAIPMLRALTRAISRRGAWYEQRAAVIGTEVDLRRVERRLRRHPELGLTVASRVTIETGPVDDDPIGLIPESDGHAPGLSRRLSTVVGDLVERAGIHRVIVASVPGDMDERSELIRALTKLHVHVDIVSADSDAIPSRSSLHYMEGLPMLTISAVATPRSRAVFKRVFDVTAAAFGLLVLAPLLAYCAVRIRFESPGPALFRQPRVGRHGRVFEMLKLRTMDMGADERKHELEPLNVHAVTDTPGMFKIPNDPRITRVGAGLRRWSLDELPQLWNVLRGDMSLVGPRPLPLEDAKLVSDSLEDIVSGHLEERLTARPGITGPWQTLGRSDIGFEDMVKLDYTYVINPSFAEDMKLLMRTIGAVLRRKGAY